MQFARFGAVILVLASPMVLSACGGGGAKSETEVTNTTVSTGQQLIDLKAALDSGAISQEEYDKEREKILSQ
ncbi:SHOCT domain-containing protein [Rhodobacteraceae bacterium NNCM2]|nr:SHOCT domain-containing protein [Coraliihabitans acroporae]